MNHGNSTCVKLSFLVNWTECNFLFEIFFFNLYFGALLIIQKNNSKSEWIRMNFVFFSLVFFWATSKSVNAVNCEILFFFRFFFLFFKKLNDRWAAHKYNFLSCSWAKLVVAWSDYLIRMSCDCIALEII